VRMHWHTAASALVYGSRCLGIPLQVRWYMAAGVLAYRCKCVGIWQQVSWHTHSIQCIWGYHVLANTWQRAPYRFAVFVQGARWRRLVALGPVKGQLGICVRGNTTQLI